MKLHLPLLLILLVMARPVSGQDLPELHDVSGVDPSDVLNIRAAPRATAAKLGTLGPDATDIEVVEFSDDGRWGRVNTGEASGWVSMAFMSAHQPLLPDQTDFDRPLRCFGAEPFWNTDFDPAGDATLTTPAAGTEKYEVLSKMMAQNRGRFVQAVRAAQSDARLTGILTRRQCSDGMSDALFGFTFDLLLEAGQTETLLTGCCTLSPAK